MKTGMAKAFQNTNGKLSVNPMSMMVMTNKQKFRTSGFFKNFIQAAKKNNAQAATSLKPTSLKFKITPGEKAVRMTMKYKIYFDVKSSRARA